MRERTDTITRLSVMDRAATLGLRLWDDLKTLGALLLVWQLRARERRRLASLDDRMLRDIGLSATDVEKEWRKPFWYP
jgi:uncharacterized protein YjiS (DUF1127 family)